MPLSINPQEGWNFQAASAPLVGDIAGTTLVAQNGGSSVVSTANGLELTVGNALFNTTSNLPSGYLITALPITWAIVYRRAGTAGASFARVWRHSATVAYEIGYNPSAAQWYIQGSGFSSVFRTVSSTVGDTVIVFFEVTTTSCTVWNGTTQVGAVATIAPTTYNEAATDVVEFGRTSALTPEVQVLAAARFAGSLTAQDRTDIVADPTLLYTLPPPPSTFSFANTAFSTSAFSVGAFSLQGDTPPPAPAAGGYRLRRAPRGGQ